jgi:predicted dehydrogenase
MRVGLVGCGRWGRNVARVLDELGVLTGVVDPVVDHGYPVLDFGEVLHLSGVVIATPPETHFQLATAAIAAGVPHVFVEKPVTDRLRDALAMQRAAQMHKTRVAVGHVQLHAAGYQQFRGARPTYLVAERFGWNPGYHGVSAWWDLAPHDVAVCVDLLGAPERVEVDQTAEAYEATLSWSDGATAVLRGSREAKAKRRLLEVDGVVYNPMTDNEPEPLRTQMEWWLAGGDNLADAVEVVRVLEAAGDPESVPYRMGAGRVA